MSEAAAKKAASGKTGTGKVWPLVRHHIRYFLHSHLQPCGTTQIIRKHVSGQTALQKAEEKAEHRKRRAELAKMAEEMEKSLPPMVDDDEDEDDELEPAPQTL